MVILGFTFPKIAFGAENARDLIRSGARFDRGSGFATCLNERILYIVYLTQQ